MKAILEEANHKRVVYIKKVKITTFGIDVLRRSVILHFSFLIVF